MIGRAHVILRQRVVTDVLGLPAVWALVLLALAAYLSIRGLLGGGALTTSTWQFAAQIAPWYAGAMGVYLTAVYLPLYLTHGFTRREFVSQLPAFVAAFSAAFAGLVVLGYVVERLVYGAAGWTQALAEPELYQAPTQYGSIFFVYISVAVVWTLVGAVLGAAFYRSTLLGIALVPFAITMIATFDVANGGRSLGPVASLLAALGVDHGLGRTLTGTAIVVIVAAAAVWLLVRNLPVRTGGR